MSARGKAKTEHELREGYVNLAMDQVSVVVERAISSLPPRDLVMLDYKAAGRSWADVAEEMGMTEEAARQQWVRSKRRITKALRREYLIQEIMEEEQ